jgi:hypothetical protein
MDRRAFIGGALAITAPPAEAQEAGKLYLVGLSQTHHDQCPAHDGPGPRGGRAMKRPWAIVFLLLFVAIVSTAPAEGQDEKAAVTEAFKGYARAWDSLDAQRILPYYHEPLMVITAAAVRSMATRADIEAWVKPIFARVLERGYARAEYSQLHINLCAV